MALVNKNLKTINLEWYDKKSLCVVLCSKGYPDEYQSNVEIRDLDKIFTAKNEFIFHAGTKKNGHKIFSNGGRVLNFVVKSKNFNESRTRAQKLINELNWQNGFFRKDIGWRVIK